MSDINQGPSRPCRQGVGPDRFPLALARSNPKDRIVSATYRDIKADILGKITRGEWKPGSLIPSEL